MRNDSENHKYSNWKVSYLLATYLFGKSIAIMGNIEMMYMSMIALCQNAVSEDINDKTQEYRSRILALFRSCIDFYDVLFRNLRTGLVTYISNGRKPNAETRKTYLRMTKVAAFFESSGKRSLISTGTKRKDDINFKFMRILLSRCDEFEEFVKFMHTKEIEEHLDVVEFQYITILRQLIHEAEDRRLKADEEEEAEAKALARGPKQMVTGGGEETEANQNVLPSKLTVRKKSSFMHDKHKDNEQEGIMIDEEEDMQQNRRTQGAYDDKTKKYLALIKKYQYEDEYDDTHEAGDMRQNRGQQNKRRGNNRRRDQEDLEDEESSEDLKEEVVKRMPVEQEEEDSLEDVDPMNRWEKKHSQNYGGTDEREDGPLERNTNRGSGQRGGRGNRGSRGGHSRNDRGGYDRKNPYDNKRFQGDKVENESRTNDRKDGGDYYERRDGGNNRGYDDRRDNNRGNDRDYDDRRDNNRGNDRNFDDRRDNYGGRSGPVKPQQGVRDTR